MVTSIRDRKFCAVLYPDDPAHALAFEKIKESFDCAYILHDCDCVEDTGELKKPHYHVVFTFPNPRYLSSVAVDLGIPENYIERCIKLNASLRYLIHADNPDKYQYPMDAVGGSLKDRLRKLVCDVSEEQQVLSLVKYLDDVYGFVSYREFLIYACENGFYSSFRRLGYGVKFLLDEKNRHEGLDLYE